MLTIRKTEEADIPALVAALNVTIARGGTTAFEEPFDAEAFRAEFLSDQNVQTLTALHSGLGPVGQQTLYFMEPGVVARLAIATFTNQDAGVRGIGRALMAQTKADAKAKGCTEIIAKIRADNVPGLSYYRGQGFEDFDVVRDVPLSDGTLVDRIVTRCVL